MYFFNLMMFFSIRKPSLPMGPNLAPYYVVEMAEYPDGDWVEVYEECRGNNIKTN